MFCCGKGYVLMLFASVLVNCREGGPCRTAISLEADSFKSPGPGCNLPLCAMVKRALCVGANYPNQAVEFGVCVREEDRKVQGSSFGVIVGEFG